MVAPTSPVDIRVDAWLLRCLFNREGIARRPEFTPSVIRSTVARPEAGQAAGALSQMVRYLDAAGREVAKAHRSLLPGGELGAGGQADPKSLAIGGWGIPEWAQRLLKRAYGVWRKLLCLIAGR